MQIRGITKADYDYVVSIVDNWFGGASAERAHPIFFYELGQHALIAEEDGSTVGFLLGFIAPTEPPTGYIHLVGIHPEHRRRGVGQALYGKFTERCRDASVARLKAITPPGNDGSRRFHTALGFEVEEHPDYAGRGRGRIVFTKNLEVL